MTFASLFAPEAIPLELFGAPAQLYPESVREPVGDEAALAEAIGELDALSLVTFDPSSQTFSIHRLVRAAARDLVGAEIGEWSKRAIGVVDAIFPSPPVYAVWKACERLSAHAVAALAACEGEEPTDESARLARHCGRYLYERGAYASAEMLLRSGLSASEARFGPDSKEVANAAKSLAHLLFETDRLPNAEALYQRALTVFSARDDAHTDVALALTDLATAFSKAGRIEEAEQSYRRALEILERVHGGEHEALWEPLNNLAIALDSAGRHDEAEPLYQRALVVARRHEGPPHPALARSLNNLADLQVKTGNLAEAESNYRQALEAFEASLGMQHPDAAICMNNLGELLAATDRRAEASALFLRALEVLVTKLGAEHTVSEAVRQNSERFKSP